MRLLDPLLAPLLLTASMRNAALLPSTYLCTRHSDQSSTVSGPPGSMLELSPNVVRRKHSEMSFSKSSYGHSVRRITRKTTSAGRSYDDKVTVESPHQ